MEIGAFCFRDMGDGCLAGKYLDHGTPSKCYTETAIAKERQPEQPFCGTFVSNWIWEEQGQDKVDNSELAIDFEGNGIYKLKWGEKYVGEGMLVDGLLVGYYHKYKLK